MKSWWPFQRRVERRESAYSGAIIELIRARAAGVSTADATALAATEFCAGLWARAFASATVSPDNFRTRALTPWMLSNAARALIRSGESIWDISVFNGAVRLRPAAHWDISGSSDPATWRYSLQLSGPTSSETINKPWRGVVHLQFGCDAGAAPWRGVSPLGFARATGRLAAALEERLGQEADTAVGYLLPVPSGDPSGEEDTDPLAALKKDLAGLRGAGAIVESTRSWGDSEGAPVGDWQPRRLGANPPATLAELRGQAFESVLSACGVPAELAVSGSQGTGQREAWRRFLHGTIQGAAAVISQELSRKLEVDITLSFDALFASDLSGRARAFQQMVTAGLDVTKAAGLAGLMESET